jgi:hypothetical protein
VERGLPAAVAEETGEQAVVPAAEAVVVAHAEAFPHAEPHAEAFPHAEVVPHAGGALCLPHSLCMYVLISVFISLWSSVLCVSCCDCAQFTLFTSTKVQILTPEEGAVSRIHILM